MNVAPSGRTWEDASSPDAIRLTRRYEQAWQQAKLAGLRLDPLEFLHSSEGSSDQAGSRLAILRTDLSLRWESGDRTGAQWYMDRFADLGKIRWWPWPMRSFACSRKTVEELSPTEFLVRYPSLGDPLRRVLDIHGLLGSATARTPRCRNRRSRFRCRRPRSRLEPSFPRSARPSPGFTWSRSWVEVPSHASSWHESGNWPTGPWPSRSHDGVLASPRRWPGSSTRTSCRFIRTLSIRRPGCTFCACPILAGSHCQACCLN